jgi:hypothetical protein
MYAGNSVHTSIDGSGLAKDATPDFDLSAIQQRNLSIVGDVHPGLNLHLILKSPMQMLPLMTAIQAAHAQTQAALRDLHYVHFARFLPSPDASSLWVITAFDGAYQMAEDPCAYNDSMRSYLMDFVAVLGPIFTVILDYIRDAPRLPVNDYPRDFIDFVIANNNPLVNPWSAYPDMTVIDILSAKSVR